MRSLLVVCCALISGTVVAGENLVRNGTFDASGTDGEPLGWKKARGTFRYEKGAGRNLTRALAFDITDPRQYDFPSLELKPEAGKRYRVSGWIRTENVKGGAGARFGLEFSDANGKYIAPGRYLSAISGTSDGWRFVEGFVDAPTNAAHAGLVAFVVKGCTGKAWFDDLSVEPAERPLLDTFVSSAYRDQAKDGEVSFVATIAADEKTIRERNVRVLFRLPNGQTGWNGHNVPIRDGVAQLTVPVASLPMGKHPVQAMVTAKDQKSGAEFAELLFERAKELPSKGARIDAQGRLIVDGKPFFPFGMYMYGDFRDKAMYDHYATGPFNCVMNYNVANPAMFDEYHRRGIRVIGCVKDAFCGWLWPPANLKCEADDIAYVADKVAAVKDHPALIAWYANDEMGVDWVGRLRKRRALLHELDPNHPVWTVQYQIGDYAKYVGTYDIAGTDPYPISRNPEGDDIAKPAKWTRLTRQGARATRALWQVPQYFDTAAYSKPKWPTSAPTEEEVSCMIWQCIAEGANGIILYAYHPLKKMDKKEPFAKKWEEICRVGWEVRRKMGLLLSDDATAEVKVVKATPDVSVRAWRMDGTLFALAVNASYGPGSVTLAAEGRTVTLELKPLGHVFEEFREPKWERPMTTRRYLHGPEAERILTYWREGKIMFGEVEHRRDWSLEYWDQTAHGAWLLYGADDAAFDFRAAKLSRREDGVPDHAQTWRTNGLEVTLAACAPFGRKPTAQVRLAVKNAGDKAIDEPFAFLLRSGKECRLVYGAPDVYAIYDPKPADWMKMPSADWVREGQTMRSGTRFVAFDAPFDWDAGKGAARFRLKLAPGESREVRLAVGRGETVPCAYEAVRRQMEADWEPALARVKEPGLLRNFAAQMLQCFAKPTEGDFTLPRQGGLQRFVWPWDAMHFLAGCDLLGYHEYVERAIDFYFSQCVRETGEAGPFRNRWACDTACVLETYARHCLETGDAQLWRRHAATAAKMCRWIMSKREADGLFPAMKSTDAAESRMKHWGWTDLSNIEALGVYADAAEKFADPMAKEAREGWLDYRAAVTKVLDHWREVSKGKDELFLPITADGSREDELVKGNFFYNHPGMFADSGLLTTDELVRLRRNLLRQGYADARGLYQRHPSSYPTHGRHVWYTTATELLWYRAWMRAGRADLAKETLDACLKLSVTDEYYVGERIHDATPWFFPWSPNASGCGRIIQMMKFR